MTRMDEFFKVEENTVTDLRGVIEIAEARLNYLESRAKYYKEWPQTQDSYLAVLEELKADLGDIRHAAKELR